MKLIPKIWGWEWGWVRGVMLPLEWGPEHYECSINMNENGKGGDVIVNSRMNVTLKSIRYVTELI